MRLGAYREVWANPAARSVLLLGLLCRAPQFGAVVVLTLHVVEHLDPRYSAAGLITTASTLALAVSGPWRGRMLDARGLRRTVAPSLAILPVCWVIAPLVGYWALFATVIIAGLFSIPAFTIVRQALVCSVDERQRRAAFALDSVLVEFAFMAGPAAGVWLATVWDTRWTLMTFQLASVAGCVAIYLADPQISTGHSDTDTARIPLRAWVTAPVLALMGMAFASTVVLSATDLSVVAGLRTLGSPGSIGWVLTLWGAGSAIGGFTFGMIQRPIPTWVVVAGLALATAPAVFATDALTMGLLLMIAGLFCAPSMAAATEELSSLVPPAARGEAFGWHGSIMTTGSALGAPLIGAAIDAYGWEGGYLAGAAAGLLMAIAGALFARRRSVPN